MTSSVSFLAGKPDKIKTSGQKSSPDSYKVKQNALLRWSWNDSGTQDAPGMMTDTDDNNICGLLKVTRHLCF